MLSNNINRTLCYLDEICNEIPFTHQRACHLLYHLVTRFSQPEVVEVACGYGKATIYLAAAAKLQEGFVRSVDLDKPLWEGKSAKDLLHQAELMDVCDINFGLDARWYLLELFSQRPGLWIDLAYIDATHTIEVDSFVALALWTHLRPGGILVFDDLNWIPMIHAENVNNFSAPDVGHVKIIFEYIKMLADVEDSAEWGGEEVEWVWGFLRKRDSSTLRDLSLQKLIKSLDQQYRTSL